MENNYIKDIDFKNTDPENTDPENTDSKLCQICLDRVNSEKTIQFYGCCMIEMHFECFMNLILFEFE
jgi:hypothetical protein